MCYIQNQSFFRSLSFFYAIFLSQNQAISLNLHSEVYINHFHAIKSNFEFEALLVTHSFD